MLEPQFFALPPDITIPEDGSYQVIGYARHGDYTLVMWRLSGPEESITGESLYQGDRHIVTDGGQLPLYQPTETIQSTVDRTALDPFSLIPAGIGAFGVPPQTAIALRNPLNQVLFELGG
jgi:hypothetical protein